MKSLKWSPAPQPNSLAGLISAGREAASAASLSYFHGDDQPNFLSARTVVALWSTSTVDTLYLVRFDGGILRRQYFNVFSPVDSLVLPNAERGQSGRHTITLA